MLVVLGAVCLFYINERLGSPITANAELKTQTEDRVLVVPVQITRDSYGIAMVDTVGQTIWIYEISGRGPAHNRLKLLAARTWAHDKKLQQFNTSEPTPEQIRLLLQSLEQDRNVNVENFRSNDSQSAD